MASISAGLCHQSSVISSSKSSNLPSCPFNTGQGAPMRVRCFLVSTNKGGFRGLPKEGVTKTPSLENERPFTAWIEGSKSYDSCISYQVISSKRGRHHWSRRVGGQRAKCQMNFDSKSAENPKVVIASPEMAGVDSSLSKVSVGSDGDVMSDLKSVPNADNGAGGDRFGGDDNGNFRGGGGGGGGGEGEGEGGGDNKDDQDGKDDEDEYGPILSAEEVFKEAESRGAVLPSDMAEAAKALGLRKLLLSRYLELQEAIWPLGAAIRGSPLLRNRMLADPNFLFKVVTEIMIDSCCATFAEVQKRGKDFWSEFELYLADLLVGIVVDIALVGMLAPFVRFGQPTQTAGLSGKINHAIGAFPSSVFEAEMPGRRFSMQQRIGTYFYKGIQYGAVGFVCGIIGQGIANSTMTLKRKLKKSEGHDVPVPPLVQSAALWGVFLAVSSNTRYQIINGLECVVEGSPLAKRFPPVALAFTVGIRFANNVYGGMQFVDWARWTGVQ